jgi:hypothetical protein
MKELLTKRFWQDVKKTFDEARKDPSSEGNGSQIPAAEQPDENAPQPPSSSEDQTGHASVRFAVT